MFPCYLVTWLLGCAFYLLSGFRNPSFRTDGDRLTNTALIGVVHEKLLQLPFDQLPKLRTQSMSQEYVYVITSKLSSKVLVALPWRQKKQRSTFVRLISTKQAVEFILVTNSTATSTLHLQNFPLCLLVEQVSKTHRIA